jgi:hypothetical protein
MTGGCDGTWAFTSKTGAALLVVAVVLGAAACSTEEEPQGELEAGATSAPSPVEETPAPSETPTPREAGPSHESEDEYEGGEGTENDNSSELFPDPVVPEQGTFYFGVYFVVSEKSAREPKVKAAETDLRNLGFEPSVGGIDCDSGAKEALGLDPSRSYTDVALYFATRSDADMFVTLYDPGVVGTAKVKTFCLD